MSIEALGLIEIDGVTAALVAHDAALKRAAVRVIGCAPVSPGKTILLFHGDVASVSESHQAALESAANRVIDALLLPGVDPAVVAALSGARRAARPGQALGVVECSTVATTLLAADAAVKAADVVLSRMHLASGFGGRGYFTLGGDQCDVEAATEASLGVSHGGPGIDIAVIAAPHPELAESAFARPWRLDPADGLE